MTLLNVMVRGENEDAAAGLLDFMRQHDNILSLTVQTMTYTGQAAERFPARGTSRWTRRRGSSAAQSGGGICFDDFITRPSAHPLCYLTCYLLKSGDRLHPLARIGPARADRESPERLVPDPARRERSPLPRRDRPALCGRPRYGVWRCCASWSSGCIPTGRPLDDFQRQQVAESARADDLHPRPHGRRHVRLFPGDALSRTWSPPSPAG